jgi:hypothetical protein
MLYRVRPDASHKSQLDLFFFFFFLFFCFSVFLVQVGPVARKTALPGGQHACSPVSACLWRMSWANPWLADDWTGPCLPASACSSTAERPACLYSPLQLNKPTWSPSINVQYLYQSPWVWNRGSNVHRQGLAHLSFPFGGWSCLYKYS